MVDVLKKAIDSTNRHTDEQILVAALTNFSLRDEVKELVPQLDASEFYNANYGKIWDAANSLIDESRILSVENLLSKLKADAPKQILDDLAGTPVRLIEVTRGIEIVRNEAMKRRLFEAMRESAQTAATADSVGEALDAFHTNLQRINGEEVAATSADLGEAIDEFWQDLDVPDDEKEPPFPTPWLELDERMNGGLRRGRLYIWGGRPGEGKSLACCNICGLAAERGLKTIYFTAEMSKSEVTARILCAGAQADYGQITRGNVDAANRAILANYSDEIKDAAITIVDKPSISIRDIRAMSAAKHRSSGLDIVFVDYLQMIQPDDKSIPREQQVAGMSSSLKVLARQLNVAVVCAVQLNRPPQQQGRDQLGGSKPRPGLESIRESDRIGQDADVVVLNHCPNGITQSGVEMELCMPKCRTGQPGVVKRIWRPDQARIE
ncbi:DnaB-like dsDNA helicase [Gordonia Phage Sephiroth]|uniref:DnaB-like dsDNA helicase n=1 Tax=Gordonia Phage Sephiroth TaxID=2767553 RepID=A0A7G9UZG2_9CAUD|nr:DnaB-like replicative helicase [Gordonia Phage Sephiroth]QNN99417.1 DnaB-like dsDNA helicase [Gordonia Phage Sephiroth]